MRIGVLGTGTVGQTLGTKLVQLDHEVKMGSRERGNDKAVAWAEQVGGDASEGSFADAAEFGELVINATAGGASLDACAQAGGDNLAGKPLLDVSNPLDFSQGFPPRLSVCNDDSLGEQLQRAHADARVVKAFNTMPAELMVNPDRVREDHTLFVAGDHDDAKQTVVELARSFGWRDDDVLDLGNLDAARGMEMILPLWVRIVAATGSRVVNVKVVS